MTLHHLVVLLLLAAAVTAVRVEIRRGAYAPAAILLFGLAVGDVARQVIDAQIGEGPFYGWRRAAWFLDQGLLLADPLGCAAAAAWIFWRRALPMPITAWVIAVASVVVRYPEVREYDALYSQADVAGVVIGLACVARWMLVRSPISLAGVAVMGIVSTQVVTTVYGPWFPHREAPRWDLVQVAAGLTFTSLTLFHGVLLWTSKPSR